MAEQPAEQVLFRGDDITVTTTKAIFGDWTTPIADITGVTMGRDHPRSLLPFLLIIPGVGVFLFGIILLFVGNITGGLRLTITGCLLASAGYFIDKSIKVS